MAEHTRRLGAWWLDKDNPSLPAPGTPGEFAPILSPSESDEVRWQEVVATGHYEPVTNGDTDDPQPFYTFDANDCPEFMMLWITET